VRFFGRIQNGKVGMKKCSGLAVYGRFWRVLDLGLITSYCSVLKRHGAHTVEVVQMMCFIAWRLSELGLITSCRSAPSRRVLPSRE
jgi:hypothetical protein